MQKDTKESLASIYLKKPKIKSASELFPRRKDIFFLALIFIGLSIFGVLLVVVLNL